MKNVIIASIPAFALLIALEALWDARRKMHRYTGKDAATNIALGIGSVIFGKLIATYFIYDFFFQLSAWRIAPSWWAWLLVLSLDDFCYYWFHRISHESRFFWNMHVVHHSSDHYNLSVAVRQSWFGGLTSWIFYVPICLLGFSPEMVLTAHGVNLVYQFWIHTQYVERMGWLEYIFNCPTHHRVHHGVNERYLDKNYGGILIIWDRLFGTFVDETEAPRYGILKPLKSYNPLWANLHAWAEMVSALRERPTLSEKLRCIFGAPAMLPSQTATNAHPAAN